MNNQENMYSGAEAENEILSPKTKRESLLDILKLLLFSGIIVGLDQYTKTLVVNNIPFLGTWLPEKWAHLEPYFRIVHWHNSGSAFGFFQNGNSVIMVLAVIASLFIVYYFPQLDKSEWPIRVAMIFQLAGAVGNLIDRIQYNYVIDFISVGKFPVFNIADSSISVGVAILILGVILQEIQDRKAREGDSNNEGNAPLEESNV